MAALTALPTMKREAAPQLKPLLNGTLDAVQALKALDRPVQHWDDWLVFITVGKLDSKTRMAWETSIGASTNPPTFKELHTFLTSRLRALEAMEDSSAGWKSSSPQEGHLKTNISVTKFKAHTASKSEGRRTRCPLCTGDHSILHCSAYKGMTATERKQVAVDNNLCFNCLGNHPFRLCKSARRCQLCSGKHNTTLHIKIERCSSSQVVQQDCETDARTAHCAPISWSNSRNRPSILLATAKILLETGGGRRVAVRALIDPCSEVSLIEENLVQVLRLRRNAARLPVMGVGEAEVRTRGMVTVNFSSIRNPTAMVSAIAYVLPRLSAYKPKRIPSSQLSFPHLRDLDLADPGFRTDERVAIILGADVYTEIIREGLRKGPPHSPIAQFTCLGWIITGHCKPAMNSETREKRTVTVQCASLGDTLSTLLERFWSLEEVSAPSSALTAEEQECEMHFRSSHTRDSTGRYIVQLPFREPPAKLGDSLMVAQTLLKKLERRLHRTPQVEKMYNSFLEEYMHLGHMELVPDSELTAKSAYYLPHHGVLRETSSTTKLRVVFNASQASSSGFSLNDLLLTGPNLLPELFPLLLRWRKHAVVFAADIEKMYRQIRLAPGDRDFQRILWRKKPDEPPSHFRLVTVTYGTSCAPYLAVRTLKQLSADEQMNYPLAAACLERDTYVDDVVSGTDSIQSALRIQRELLALLTAGGFNLRKWSSNKSELLEALPADARSNTCELACNFDGISSLLGLKWHSTVDAFLFTVQPRNVDSPVTKRTVFREVARLFDPLGFLAPVVTAAKIFMQSLWLLKVNWDDPLPESYANHWQSFYEQLQALSTIRVPRWLFNNEYDSRFELHGFADASERAYAAVVYLRSSVEGSEPFVSLVASKTRVAPLRQVSVPRLELCAASLLTRLVKTILNSLDQQNCTLHLWSDSTVVLSWLQGHSTRWKTFVANRVSDIQTALPAANWRHIRSAINPADVASRGLLGSQLRDHTLWWKGPPFLSQSNYNYDQHTMSAKDTDQEVRAKHVNCLAATSSPTFIEELIAKFSSLSKLLRTVGWCLRFLNSARDRATRLQVSPHLTPRELNNAKLTVLRSYQQAEFSTEMKLLSKGRHCSRGPLSRLAPFIDDNGLLRVGGRLKHSLLDDREKHPIILPQKGHLVTLIIRDAHNRLLHGGTQLTLSSLRRSYWILAGRRAVKRTISSCMVCWRWRAESAHQQMSNLPSPRAQPSRPFTNTGVDYAGPLLTKTAAGRGYRARKSYVAVFVCLATRAVHLELVSDATTAAFLAAFHRFISRRGSCVTMFSDQGTNFVGADRELRRLFNEHQLKWQNIAFHLAQEGTTWKFNPPGAPHFGGIWEAAVKSLKFHLRRIAGNTPLTFEETSTLLTQIEACLNSRPIAALTDDVDSINALTPAHFLIGSPLISLPEPSLSDVQISPLKRWNLIQQMRDHFWNRWSSEYLHQLQTRGKWRTPLPDIQVGDICLIKNELTPPSCWPLGRVTATHVGDNHLVRVVTIRTANTTMTRPITKICPLPRPSEEG